MTLKDGFFGSFFLEINQVTALSRKTVSLIIR